MDLRVSVGGVNLKTPLIIASGVFSLDLEEKPGDEVGACVTKTVTWKKREGNAPPRLCEVYSGLLNSIGLQNPGVEAFLAELSSRKVPLPLIGSVGGESVEEYVMVAKKLSQYPFLALEVNISCPNVKEGGAIFGKNPDVAAEITRRVKEEVSLPVWVKLTPEGDVLQVAEAVAKAGADALVVANTYPAFSINIEERKPALGGGYGGLSGPAIKPLTLRLLCLIKERVDVPLIGCGGVYSARDALEYLICGAAAVEVGTAFLVDSGVIKQIVGGIVDYCSRKGLTSVRELINTLRWEI